MPSASCLVTAYARSKKCDLSEGDVEILLKLARESEMFEASTCTTNARFMIRLRAALADSVSSYSDLLRFRCFEKEFKNLNQFLVRFCDFEKKSVNLSQENVAAWQREWRDHMEKSTASIRKHVLCQSAEYVQKFRSEIHEESFCKLSLRDVMYNYRKKFCSEKEKCSRFECDFVDIASASKGKTNTTILREGILLGYAIVLSRKLKDDSNEEMQTTFAMLKNQFNSLKFPTGVESFQEKEMQDICKEFETKICIAVTSFVSAHTLRSSIVNLKAECAAEEKYLSSNHEKQ